MSVLSIRRLEFERNPRCRIRIDGIDLQPGQVLGVLGPNGAGKSTFLKLVCGDCKGKGSISLHGRPIENWERLELARHLAVLPQSSTLDFQFSAREVVELGLTPLRINRTDANAMVRRLLRECRCEEFAERPFPSLSGGEKQRVHLARVLLQLSQAEAAPLFLLDEPTSAQDIGQQHMVLTLVRRQCKESGSAAVVILHDLNHAVNYCDDVILLKNGHMVGHGDPLDTLNEASIEAAWGFRPTPVIANGGTRYFY